MSWIDLVFILPVPLVIVASYPMIKRILKPAYQTPAFLAVMIGVVVISVVLRNVRNPESLAYLAVALPLNIVPLVFLILSVAWFLRRRRLD